MLPPGWRRWKGTPPMLPCVHRPPAIERPSMLERQLVVVLPGPSCSHPHMFHQPLRPLITGSGLDSREDAMSPSNTWEIRIGRSLTTERPSVLEYQIRCGAARPDAEPPSHVSPTLRPHHRDSSAITTLKRPSSEELSSPLRDRNSEPTCLTNTRYLSTHTSTYNDRQRRYLQQPPGQLPLENTPK